MGPTMRPGSHRIPVHLPAERSLEEVILARKMTPSAESQFATSRYERYTSSAGAELVQRGMLASPSSPASFLSQLPSEVYTREISSRLGRRRGTKAVRRSTPDGYYGGGGVGSILLSPQYLRPLTGVSRPSTAQSSFSLADYAVEGPRPTTSSRSPERGVRTTPCAYKNSNGGKNGYDDLDTTNNVRFLTDKCNALAERLEQVETQLFRERADGKKVSSKAAAAASSQCVESSSIIKNNNNNSSNNDDDGNITFDSVPKMQQRHMRVPTADPSSSPRNFRASSRTGAYLTPRTSDSSSCSNSSSNLAQGAREKGKVRAQQQQQTPSSGLGPGVMVPPEVVQTIKDAKWPRRTGGGNKMDADALHSEIVEKEIAERFEIVTDGIEKLENVFSGAAQILEHRVRAITTISSAIRMFLQRSRYLRGKEALRAWRTSHSLQVLQCMGHEVFRQKKIEAGLESLQNRHRLAVISKTFRWWSTVIGSNEHRNHQLKQLEERIRRRQLFDLVGGVFRALVEQTIGPSSSRQGKG
ncbi:unnamed protein product [Pylaiella littoralis]